MRKPYRRWLARPHDGRRKADRGARRRSERDSEPVLGAVQQVAVFIGAHIGDEVRETGQAHQEQFVMTDEIAAGRDAWARLKDREKPTWSDWLSVAGALEIGKAAAMATAKTNRMVGSRYNAAMGAWLAENGLVDVSAQERYRLAKIMENLDAIGCWGNVRSFV
jgi:hypothetical protein